MTMKTTTTVSLLLCAALAQSVSAQCRITELETQPGWQAVARSLTPKGLLAGNLESLDRQSSRPAQWTLDGRLTLLPYDPQYAVNRVSDANDSGSLVGYRGLAPDQPAQAVRWTPQGAMPLSTAASSYAEAVNAKGFAVGYSTLPSGLYQAHRWAKDGTAFDLPGLNGGWSIAIGINRVGQMVGFVGNSNGGTDAVTWTNKGELRVLPSLGGLFTLVNRISESGSDVVGLANPSPTSFDMHPVLWRNGVEVLDLGTLGGTFGSASAVNNQQVVVGSATKATGETSAFVWSAGRMTDLNTMVPKRFLNAGNRLDGANRISDQGVILAYALQSVTGQPERGRSVILKRCLE